MGDYGDIMILKNNTKKMNRIMIDIAKNILLFEQDGLSKVRFAKTLYFVHKELIRKNLLEAKDIAYIRMPLGPVPDGFMELDQDPNLAVSTKSTTLLYNAKVYKLSKASKFRPLAYSEEIKKVLQDLNRFGTSMLVELSHEDPSWKTHSNSQRYFIEPADLEHILPKRRKKASLSEAQDDQYLQAGLVSGMMHEIVEESTALEYPTEA